MTTFSEYERAKREAAALFQIPLEAVSHDQAFDILLDYATPGAAMTLWPRTAPMSVLSSGPYHVAPGLTATGRRYTLLAGTGVAYRTAGEPFPDDDEWPGMPCTLLEEGSGGNG